jgi:hypothetical protein
MTEAVCFRCDWQGSARGRSCPSCGSPLYRGARGEAGEGGASPVEARIGDVPSRRPPPRGRAFAIAGVLALVAVASIELLAGGRPSSTSPEPSGPEVIAPGGLAYTADDGRGGSTLWTVDLNGGIGRPGPSVPARTVELVDLSGAAPGWIGLERRTRGHTVAAVVRGLVDDADVEPLGSGDLVAWGPGGRSLVFARNGPPDQDGCAPVRISLVTVLTQKVGWALDDPGFCGPVLSLSRSEAATYFTAASGDRLSVYLTGSVGVPHLTFEGVGMLSASPPAAFLLRPDGSPHTSSGASREAGTMLGWKGIGGPVSVGDGEHVLSVHRVLAWSSDGSRVALLGRMGARSGVFVMFAGSGTGPRVPRFVMPAGRTVDGTFDADGRLYLATDGAIYVTRDDGPARIALPAGAPAPSGPIVWIP